MIHMNNNSLMARVRFLFARAHSNALTHIQVERAFVINDNN